MARGLLLRVGFNLHFVTSSKINAAIGFLSTIEFDVQLEVLKFGIVNELWAVARFNEVPVFDLPLSRRIRLVRLPSCQVFAIKKFDGLVPLFLSRPFYG